MRKLLNLSDIELIKHFRNGHDNAFEVLFYRYKEDIRKVIVHYVRDKMVTDDLSQDVFLRIYTSLKGGQYNEQGKFRPWALCIAHNLCMDHLRKAAQLLPSVQIVPEKYMSTAADHTAENWLVVKQQQRYLNVFINRLPEDQKKVVSYRYFEGLSFKEISALMNTSVNTSLGRMRYGLRNLRKQVNKTPSLL